MRNGLSPRCLGGLLALTALPVVLTSAFLRVLASPPGDVAQMLPRSPYRDFAVYAVANWITFAVVVRVAGWRQLRAYGLRMRVTMWRCVSTCAGFVIGVGIYVAVSSVLRQWGLPPVRGMEFESPTRTELAVMFFSVTVTAAFCEEIFFRVLWVGALRTHVRTSLAGAMSIVAFATIHYPYFGAGGVLFISVWALVPLALFVWWEDCTASVVMHMMNNTFAYLVVPMLFSANR
ncbi:MAG: CPBP family intramembrane metalloprotease [Deltaproteobacteria bacterium]|nr:CPBP family intramembrane metalloprotease [Deltaproteobacteria bacterium]